MTPVPYPVSFDEQYLEDSARWQGKPLDNPESPIPDKVGTVDTAESGFMVVCGGFMGNESLTQQHYVSSVDEGIKWLQSHGCTKIINLCK